ncbi:hypothetical protein HUS70_12075 [Pandoraea nosoerga]|uniref:hypothetical protein n=1 Tax=Pandoraea nosoerga TaxID=2508296 RepID=UPI0012429D6B|nr:hypothetical protein [Pandoraea nosoerga]MBN4666197.1 hypothetical protein [Pandoraea nosoerga]MBN4676253.1 hypothetical protein [Pandoraea nosoerga]MBN4681289.1 hypothetical protein [Pandoraea nosoerga]MBN4745364.1 hypothetical protein [Pandoraea nosoerga]
MNVLFWCKKKEERRYAKAMPAPCFALIYQDVLFGEATLSAARGTVMVLHAALVSEVSASPHTGLA